MKKIFLRRTQGLAGVLVFGAILVGLNFLLAGLPWRADLTEERLYTLSAGTKELLAKLDRPVVLKFFATAGDAIPVPVRQYAKRVQDLLEEYRLHGGGRVTVEVYDPQPDSDAEEWAGKYGLQATPVGAMGGPDLYLGLAAVSGPREAAIPMLSPDNEPQLEYQVTRLVHEVAQSARPKLGLLSSLPLAGEPPSPFAPRRDAGRPWVAVEELRKLYEVTSVAPDAAEIPSDLTALVVVHPRDLGEKTLFAIDQFVLRGGRLLAFVDPVCIAQLETEAQNPMMGMMGMGAQSDLNRLTQAWGVELEQGRMVADPEAATPVRSADGRAERNVAWLSLRAENLDRLDVSVAGLEYLMLPFAGAFSGKPASNLTMTALLTASPGAGLTDAMQAMFPGAAPKLPEPAAQPPMLAVRLAGRFPTAFPDGAPAADKPKDDDDPSAAKPEEKKDETAAPALKEATTHSVVVLVADTDLLYDRFAVERVAFFGYSAYQLANDNLGFFLNMVEQLAGSETLIGLRSRGTFDRPFSRVLALERRAAEQWRAEEEDLQRQLDDTRQRLSELQAKKDPTQKVVLTDEQRREIERFREKQFETQRALKEVRKKLRRDIDLLGLWLKGINMAGVPLAVAAFGVAHGLHRRRRAGA